MGKDVIINKIDQNDDELVLSVEKGGTGGNNQTSAEQNLEFILSSKLNAPLGVAGLDNTGRVKKEQLPISIRNLGISIDGAKQVTAGSISNYSIVGYSGFDTYTISVSAGSVSRVDGVITLVAPSVAQSIILTVNGKAFTIDVVPISAYANTPSITSPVSGAINLGPNITITSSVFGITGGSDTHEGTDWQIATDTGFTNVVASVTNSDTDKLSWSIQGLLPATQYYIRTRHKGINTGYSNWSPVVSFNTKALYIPNTETAKLIGIGQFGYSVDVSANGNYAIIGAQTDDTSKGAAYIFIRSGSTWSQQAKLVASDGKSYENFGCSVAISQDSNYAIVGAQNATGTGAGYIFVRSGSTWTQQAKLSSFNPADGVNLGLDVDINSDGTRVILGNPEDVSKPGLSYIFVRTGTAWSQEAKLIASDGVNGNSFGYSVAISNDGSYVVVGAYRNISNRGAAYIFVRSGSTWSQQAKLVADDSNYNNYFGISVDISGDSNYVIIGAYTASTNGKAYIFVRSNNTWSQQAGLSGNYGGNDQFGYSVSINNDGTRAIVGAVLGDKTTNSNEGSCYIFSRISDVLWPMVFELNASDGIGNLCFGYSISISGDGNYIIAGTQDNKCYIFS